MEEEHALEVEARIASDVLKIVEWVHPGYMQQRGEKTFLYEN